MDREKFEALARKAILGLPPKFLDRMENIEVEVQEWPSSGQMREGGVRQRHNLLGLYEGVPLTERTTQYQLVTPDKITLFQRPIELVSNSEEEMEEQVREVVVHEIAHHFGISDERLKDLGVY